MKTAEFLALGVVAAVLAGCPASDDSGDDTSAVSMTMSATMSTTTPSSDTDMMTTDAMTDTAEESSSGSAACPDDSISFAADIQPIFDASCVTDCHVTGGEWPTLLLDGNAYDTIVDEESLQTQTVDELVLIAPNDVENSYIVHKLRGTHTDLVDPALALQRMPSEIVTCEPTEEGCRDNGTMLVEGDPLPEDQIQLIEDWINCGAPE